MTFSDLDENTLGAIVGKRRSQLRSASPTRALRQARAMGATLGTGYLGLGAGVVAGLQLLYGIILLVWNWDLYPNTLPVVLAWLLLWACIGGVAVSVVTRGENMPDWLFFIVTVSVFGVIGLDFVAIWPLNDVGTMATASACAGCLLLVSVTLRRSWEILLVAALIAVAFMVAIVFNSLITTETIPGLSGVIALAVLPSVFGVYVVRRFRRLVQVELDRVLVQSTVSAPRFAVGMLASEELARLDLAAEELLESVATKTISLPLDKKTASRAASLATELRLHLIEGRRETWLYHAISESEVLGKAVTLTDRGSLSGLLDQRQRDGLLSAVWLLVSDRDNKPCALELTLGPAANATETGFGHKIAVPVLISTTDIPRNRVDPATWEAIGKVGEFVDSTQDSSVRIEIQCLVDNPADR